MLAKLLNPPSVVKAESRMTQLHAVHKETPWAAKFGWFNHGRCQKALALRGMKDNVRVLLLLLFRLARVTPVCRCFLLFCSALLSCSTCFMFGFMFRFLLHCTVTVQALATCSFAMHFILRSSSYTSLATHRTRAHFYSFTVVYRTFMHHHKAPNLLLCACAAFPFSHLLYSFAFLLPLQLFSYLQHFCFCLVL